MTQSQLPSTLLRIARAYAGQITKKAKAYAPNHLRPFIHSSADEIEPGRIIIRTIADIGAKPTGPGHPNYGSSDARAQEYGSGLRAKRGAKAKYIITPKTSPFLEFLGTNQYDGYLIRTQQVEHPGIQAANNGRGYIAPAINEVRKSIRERIAKDGADAIRIDIRRSFGL